MRLSRRDFLGLAGGVGLVAATASLGLIRLGPEHLDRDRTAPAKCRCRSRSPDP